MKSEHITIGFLIYGFLIFTIMVNITGQYDSSLVVSIGLLAVSILAYIRYSKRKQLIEDHNRFVSVHIAGCHPLTGEIPNFNRFKEDIIVVPHKDVSVHAEEWRDRLVKAQNRHKVQVFEYSYQEPVSREAVNEYWAVEEGEINYPSRVVNAVALDRSEVHTRQYNVGAKEYRKVVMGQTIEL